MTNVSKITVNGNDYDIKDTEARSGLSNKQDTLVSGTNIKTINGNSLLGSGDLTVGGSQVQSDWNVSDSSSMAYIVNKPTIPTTTSSITNNSTEALTSGGAYTNLVTSVTAGTSANILNVTKNGTTSTITINSVSYASSASTATSASYITGYLSKYVGKTLTSGAAISANQLVYMYNGKIYPITNKTYNLNTEFGIQICTSSVSSSSSVYYFYLKQKASVTSLTNISHATLSSGSKCYLRCTHDSSGNIKSDNYVTTSMSAGYTWYYIGQAISATEIYVDTTNSFFISLNSNGEVFRINGKKIGTDLTLKTINNQSLIGTGNIVAGAVNLRNNEELKLWQGSEYDYNNGEIIDTYRYYGAESVPNAVEYSDRRIEDSKIIYFRNKFSVFKDTKWYVSDDGITWTEKSSGLPIYSINVESSTNGVDKILSGDMLYTYNENTDSWTGVNIWSNISISTYDGHCSCYGNGLWIIAGTDSAQSGNNNKTNKIFTSTDGINWTEVTVPVAGYWWGATYGNGKWIVTSLYGADGYIYSEDGSTWISNSFPYSRVYLPSFGGNKFILTTDNTYYNLYSTDGINWNTMNTRPTNKHGKVIYSNGIYVDPGSQSYSNTIEYSTDGINWVSIQVSSTRQWSYNYSVAQNGIFLIPAYSGYGAYINLQIDNKYCYVIDNPATTSSRVYTGIDQYSIYSISSVSGSTITLSDSNTYTANPSNNIYKMGTVGEAHPNYLCFISGVGIKIGNTFIATNNSSS